MVETFANSNETEVLKKIVEKYEEHKIVDNNKIDNIIL